MKKLKWLDTAMLILLLIGGLNWGLVALLNFDLVNWITFGMAWLDTTLKVLVGVSAVVGIFRFFRK